MRLREIKESIQGHTDTASLEGQVQESGWGSNGLRGESVKFCGHTDNLERPIS